MVPRGSASPFACLLCQPIYLASSLHEEVIVCDNSVIYSLNIFNYHHPSSLALSFQAIVTQLYADFFLIYFFLSCFYSSQLTVFWRSFFSLGLYPIYLSLMLELMVLVFDCVKS